MLFPTRRLCSFISRFFLLLAFLSACLFLLYGVNQHFSQQSSVRRLVGDDHHHHDHSAHQKESIVVRETNEHRLTLEKRRLLQKNDSSSSSSSSSSDVPEVKIGNRPISLYVHFDLKGAAPKVSYFEQLFPLLRKWGAHGVCMEYEDMFPFEGILDKVKHQQAYTKDEINRINQLAEENHLDVMPLLQTYGHLEFVLKLKEFSELRENAKYPQVITPCVNQTYVVLFAMIDQYLQLHPNIHWFHIGHDEVYYFLGHPSCEEFRRATGIQSQYELFAHHLGIITNYIKEKYPKVSLFVWHDVLQNLNTQTLQKHNLLTRINPVLWSYREEMGVEGFVVGPQSTVFGQFKSLWGATAFKGAAHEVATISDVKHYFQNQVSWIQQLNSYIPTKWQNFDGMIITGWSRYDHFLSLCELLPYAIPSLVFSLTAWKEPYKSQDRVDIYTNQPLQKYVQQLLQCSAPLHLNIQEHTMKPIPKCKFPGAAIYESMVALPSIWAQVEQSESFVDKFVTDLHVKYEYIHVKRGEECLEKLRPAMSLLNQFIESFRKAMDEVFPPQVAIEWLETYFMKRYRAVKKRHDFIEKAVTEQKTWLPRPIPNLDKLELN